MARPEKVTAVNEIAEKIERAQSLFLTDFTGLNVEAINELRRLLRENNVEYRVVKNTLARLAADKVGREDLKPHLIGPTAIAFGYTDPSLPARLIGQFAQKTGKPEVKAILFEGQMLQKEALEQLRNLPSREELLAQIMGGLKSPITRTVMVLKGLLRNLVGVLDAVSKIRGEEIDQEQETAVQPDNEDGEDGKSGEHSIEPAPPEAESSPQNEEEHDPSLENNSGAEKQGEPNTDESAEERKKP